VSLSSPSSAARGHHVVGEVQVAVGGPDLLDEIFYAVFASPRDARADMGSPTIVSGAHARVVGKVPGYRLPSVWTTGSVTGKNAFGKTVTNGVTGMVVQEGSVLVAAATASGDSSESGNVPATLALLKSGIRHLQRIEARLSG
jgi:hypothetical protein